MNTLAVRSATFLFILLGLFSPSPGFWILTSEFLAVNSEPQTSHSELATPPLGLPPVPVPETNPLTPEKIALGRQLFFDRRLSPNDTMSCAMCHVPTQGFTVNETRLAVGMNGQSTKRNPPALYNVAYLRVLFHDGREFTLEDQIISPLTNPVEMANPSMGYVVNKIRRLPEYEEQFQKTFGESVSVATLGKAIASYERTLLSGNSPFDRWYFGKDQTAVSQEVKVGFKIFSGKGQCITCHTVTKEAALFTNQSFHNTGVAHLQLIPEKTVDVDLGGGLTVKMPRTQVNEVLTPPNKIEVGTKSHMIRPISGVTKPHRYATSRSLPPTCTTARY